MYVRNSIEARILFTELAGLTELFIVLYSISVRWRFVKKNKKNSLCSGDVSRNEIILCVFECIDL